MSQGDVERMLADIASSLNELARTTRDAQDQRLGIDLSEIESSVSGIEDHLKDLDRHLVELVNVLPGVIERGLQSLADRVVEALSDLAEK